MIIVTGKYYLIKISFTFKNFIYYCNNTLPVTIDCLLKASIGG